MSQTKGIGVLRAIDAVGVDANAPEEGFVDSWIPRPSELDIASKWNWSRRKPTLMEPTGYLQRSLPSTRLGSKIAQQSWDSIDYRSLSAQRQFLSHWCCHEQKLDDPDGKLPSSQVHSSTDRFRAPGSDPTAERSP